MHTGEKPYSCNVCEKSYTTSSGLSKHNKTAAHFEKMKCKNANILLTQSSFVDSGESIKILDIKEDIKEEESVDDSFAIHQEIVCEYIKEELREEESVEDVDCGESIKIEDIKEEIKEEENVYDPSSISCSTETYVKNEIKEEVDEEQGFDDSNLDTDNLVDCSEYVQVEMNLTKWK